MQSQLKDVVRIFILGEEYNFIPKKDEYSNVWQIDADNKNLCLDNEFGQTLAKWTLKNRVDESGELYQILERETAKDHLILPGNLEMAVDAAFKEVLDFSSKTDYRAINTQELRQILEQYIRCPLTVIAERKLRFSPHFEVTVKSKVIEIRNSKWYYNNYDIGLSSNLGPDDVPQVIAIFSSSVENSDDRSFSIVLDKPVKESAQLLLTRILDFMN